MHKLPSSFGTKKSKVNILTQIAYAWHCKSYYKTILNLYLIYPHMLLLEII
jgi:hypothetical protein